MVACTVYSTHLHNVRRMQRTCERNCREYQLQNELGFSALIRAGDKLADLYVDFEPVELWPIKFERVG